MRKYIRQIMRFQAKQNGYKPSKFVHTMWYRLQERKGSHQRHLANIARGTRPKRKWKTAYERTFG